MQGLPAMKGPQTLGQTVKLVYLHGALVRTFPESEGETSRREDEESPSGDCPTRAHTDRIHGLHGFARIGAAGGSP